VLGRVFKPLPDAAGGSIAVRLWPTGLCELPPLKDTPLMTPNLLFWPGNDVVTFVVQKGEDFTVTVVPPARFMDGLMAANALLTQEDFGPDEAALQGKLHQPPLQGKSYQTPLEGVSPITPLQGVSHITPLQGVSPVRATRR
jgi:hypothetical protein